MAVSTSSPARQAGQLTVLCYGQDRSLDPSNTSGPYYPNVDTNKQIQVNAFWNLLPEAQAGGTNDWVTTGITAGWTGSNATLTYATFLMLHASSAATMSAQTPTGVAAAYPYVQPGNWYTGMLSSWAGRADTNAASTARSITATLTFYNAAGTSLGSTAGTPVNDTAAKSGGLPIWTIVSVQALAPANAVTAALTYTVTSPANAEYHSLQQPSIHPAVGSGGAVAPVPAVAPPGGVVQLFTGYVDKIAPLWTNNLSTDIQITATDSLRMLDQDYVPSIYRATIIADGATWIWPFGDSVREHGCRDRRRVERHLLQPEHARAAGAKLHRRDHRCALRGRRIRAHAGAGDALVAPVGGVLVQHHQRPHARPDGRAVELGAALQPRRVRGRRDGAEESDDARPPSSPRTPARQGTR